MFSSKKIKSIIFIIIIFLMMWSTKVCAVVSQTRDFFVNDYAEVLSEETKRYIMQTNQELEQKTGAQIVVVTVTSLDGQDLESYATELFRKFGIGDSKKNNGVLLLCSTGDRKFRIEVGYGLEGALTDGKTGRIQDEYIIPYLKDDNYDEGIKNGFSAVLSEVANEYNVTIDGQINPVAGASDSMFGTDSVYMVLLTFFGFIFPFCGGPYLEGKKSRLKIWGIYAVIYFLGYGIARLVTGDAMADVMLMGAFPIGIVFIMLLTNARFGGGRMGWRLFRWWFFFRWRLFRRRRFFWWWRKLTKLLKLTKKFKDGIFNLCIKYV